MGGLDTQRSQRGYSTFAKIRCGKLNSIQLSLQQAQDEIVPNLLRAIRLNGDLSS